MKLLLVDGSAVLHRAYHAYPSLTTKTGQVVGTVYGVASILVSALSEIAPTHVVVAWDLPKPTFRHTKYVGYKAQRPKADEEMVEQIPLVKEVIGKMGLRQIEQEGYEADDIIGTLARRAKGEVVILTGDQDTMQLVSDKVRVMMPPRGKEPAKVYGVEEVVTKYGVRPDQMVDYKALVGDASDNIPGVAGIGPKGAAELVQKYEDLKNIYENLSQIPVSQRTKLEEGKDSAHLSKELSQIETNMEINLDEQETEYQGLKKDELKGQFEELGFKSLIRRIWPEETEKRVKLNENQLSWL